MDPITTSLVAALAAGVVSSTTKVGGKLLVDAYEALKAAIKSKLGINNEVSKSVDALEAKPNSQGRKVTLQEEVEAAGLLNDPQIIGLAKDLLQKVEEHSSSSGGQVATGNYIAQADRGSSASVNINTDKK